MIHVVTLAPQIPLLPFATAQHFLCCFWFILDAAAITSLIETLSPGRLDYPLTRFLVAATTPSMASCSHWSPRPLLEQNLGFFAASTTQSCRFFLWCENFPFLVSILSVPAIKFLFQHFLHPFFALASFFDPTSTNSFFHYIFSWFLSIGVIAPFCLLLLESVFSDTSVLPKK